MKIGRVTGTVTATAKNPALVGGKLLVVDVTDGSGKLLEPGVVAVDTVGAGVGDQVLVVTGSAARIPAPVAGLPIDASIIAVVDRITLKS